MATIQENLNKIKQAVLGIEVRDAIHDSIEQCYNDVSNSETLADAAVSRANSAAQNAESKAASAQSAASAANAATEKANSAATSATEGASKVNAAVEDAEAATQAANTAAQNANEKATLAEQQASAAETAAANANEKATQVEEAVSAAEIATQDANDATEAANTAAAKAETSSQKADSSAEKADASSKKADTSAANADEKAQAAQTAADNIGDAAERAEAAAASANTAAQNANEKATLAGQQASAAEQAAKNADTATTAANAAAKEASTQAASASTASATANASAKAANDAADNANTVAEDVSDALEQVQGAITTATEAANNASEQASKAESLITSAQGTIDAANEAAQKASTAADGADLAIRNCETASGLAKDAANTANTAADNANAKAELANQAVEDADAAVTAANDAVSRAEAAAQEASSVASDLEEALQEVQTAVGNANSAIQDVNAAKTNTEAATEAAKSATTKCENATDAAKDAASECNKHMNDLPTVRWYSGTAITGQSAMGTPFPNSGISYAHNGDMYLNTDTSDVYRCMSAGTADLATWAWQTNIRGLVFTPSVDENGNISWSNNGTLDNPETKNIRGPQGFYFTPSVTEEGILSWTNNGELENPDDVNLKGPQGEPGKAPRVGQNGYWEVWDNESQDWAPTNVFALPARILKGEIPLEGWSEDESGWVKTTISLEGIDPKCALIADLIQNGEKEHDEPLEIGWLLLTRMFATESQIEIWAREIPEVALPFQLFVIDTRENAGTGEIMLMRRGGSGINTKSLEDAVVELDHSSWTYDGSEHCPVVTSVTLKGEKLVEKQDYVCLYVPATDVGQYSLEILGVRDYGGSVVTASWSIEKAAGSVSLSSESVTVKGVMGTKNSTITVTKPALCEITAESLNPEFATAQIIDGNKVQVTSVKAGQTQVVVKTNDTNFTEAQTTLTVIIQKDDGSISVQPTEITIQGEAGTTGEVTLNFVGNGAITVSQSRYVTATRADKKLTLKSVEAGTDTLTISIAETADYTGASCKLQVTVQFRLPVSDTFQDNTWEAISQACAAGEAKQHWNIGDEKSFTRGGVTYHFQIGGFDHDDLDPTDSRYNDPTYNHGSKKPAMTLIMKEVFTDNHRMHTSNDNTVSWKGCEMRTTTIPQIKSEMDQDLIAVIRTVTKKTAQSGNDGTIVSTPDDLFMLCELEVWDSSSYAKPGEGTQYEYFKAGNSRVKNQSGSAKWYWLRSPRSGNTAYFMYVRSNGNRDSYNASDTNGGVVLCVCI